MPEAPTGAPGLSLFPVSSLPAPSPSENQQPAPPSSETHSGPGLETHSGPAILRNPQRSRPRNPQRSRYPPKPTARPAALRSHNPRPANAEPNPFGEPRAATVRRPQSSARGAVVVPQGCPPGAQLLRRRLAGRLVKLQLAYPERIARQPPEHQRPWLADSSDADAGPYDAGPYDDDSYADSYADAGAAAGAGDFGGSVEAGESPRHHGRVLPPEEPEPPANGSSSVLATVFTAVRRRGLGGRSVPGC